MAVFNDFSTVNRPPAIMSKHNKYDSIYSMRLPKKDLTDRISEKIINKRDIEDSVTMPRAIFKGYLCFTAGTIMNSIAATYNKESSGGKFLGTIGSCLAILGTFNFVKPFLLRQTNSKGQK